MRQSSYHLLPNKGMRIMGGPAGNPGPPVPPDLMLSGRSVADLALGHDRLITRTMLNHGREVATGL